MQYPFPNQLIDGITGLERRVELDPRLWPEQTALEFVVNKASDPGVADRNKAFDVIGIVMHQAVAYGENIHEGSELERGFNRKHCYLSAPG